jgi:cytochrome c-type biogenesis protein CcmH
MKVLPAVLLGIALAFAALHAGAKDATPLAVDEAVEKRMVGITEELRCLVCQNESLAGSRAELAQDLRQQIRELIKAGKSDQEIMEFMVGRYGDFVRYRPPMKPTTWLLWLGPFVLLAIAIAALAAYLRRRSKRLATDTTGALSAEEQARAARLLQSGAESRNDGARS